MTQKIDAFIRVVAITTRRFFIEKYPFRVSALAFTTIVSLVPLLSISVFFISLFPIFSNLIYISKDYIFSNFIPTSASAIQKYFEVFIQQAAHLPILSILFLIFTAMLMINTIDETMNDIWNVSEKRKRIFVWSCYAIILLLAPYFIGLSVFLTSYLFSLYLFTKITFILIFVIPVIINTILFSMLYIFAPNINVRKGNGILGGFIAALLIETARILFARYVAYFSNYAVIYGVFSILPLFLIWIYICWFIILWCAVFTHTLSHIKAPKESV